MISLDQVKLLETKVVKAIDYVKRVTEEKQRATEENKRLATTLESYRKRIEELEVLMQRFKEDQGKIEDGILSALDRLNQFEDAIEKSLAASPEKPALRTEAPPAGGPASGAVRPHEAAVAFSASLPVGEILEGPEPEEEPDDVLVQEDADDDDDDELEEGTDQGSGEAELDIF